MSPNTTQRMKSLARHLNFHHKIVSTTKYQQGAMKLFLETRTIKKVSFFYLSFYMKILILIHFPFHLSFHIFYFANMSCDSLNYQLAKLIANSEMPAQLSIGKNLKISSRSVIWTLVLSLLVRIVCWRQLKLNFVCAMSF